MVTNGNPLTDHLDLWTSALLNKSTAGRGSNGKLEAYGIKKLRELILELAVRGKLVPQDADDEAVGVLLKKIAIEKASLFNGAAMKKDKALPEVTAAQKPYLLPQGWQWVRFGSIALHNSGKTLDRGRNSGQLRDYITTSNLYWGRFDLDGIRQMPIEDGELEKCTARKGDLLICEGGEAGRAAVWREMYDICFQNHIHRARFFGDIDPYYLYRFLEKLNATGEINEHRKGVGISNMSSKALALIAVPLPPLAEQHRIVAKVDELMALCDRLEQQQAGGQEAHQTLVETLLGTLTQTPARAEPVEARPSTSSGRTEFEEAWTRIAEHFDTLFTTEHSIEQLKQTILQLAVMGKLVPQDPNDEPASAILKNIRAEKVRLIAAGKLNKEKLTSPMTQEEQWCELPNGWVWARFTDYAVDIATGPFGSMIHQSDYVPNGIPLINPSHMINDEIVPEMSVAVSKDMAKKLESYSLHDGDIVMARRGEVGRIAMVTENEVGWLCGTGSFVLRFTKEPVRDYLKLVFRCEFIRNYLAGEAVGTTMVNLNHAILKKMPIAVPPLAEQHRIVAKVDELMTLCDTLKARLKAAQATQINLADAIVELAAA